MTDLRKAAEMALAALEYAQAIVQRQLTTKSKQEYSLDQSNKAIEALRQTLAQDKPDRTGMTYYKNNACTAQSAYSHDCICWTSSKPAQPEQEHFCDTHCVHTDHHPDCKLAQDEQEPDNWWDNKEYVKSRFGDNAKIVGVKHGLPKDAFKHTISEPVKEQTGEPVESLEPVAHLWECLGRWSAYLANNGTSAMLSPPGYLIHAINAATKPPKREWVGLTDEEIYDIWNYSYDENHFACDIEAKLKEKNGY